MEKVKAVLKTGLRKRVLILLEWEDEGVLREIYRDFLDVIK